MGLAGHGLGEATVTAFIVVATYLFIGSAAAVVALRRAPAPTGRTRAAMAALLLWPYTLPFASGARAGETAEEGAEASAEIAGHELNLETALGRARGVGGLDLDRVARMAARLGRRLRRLDARLQELEGAIDGAPEGVRAPLEELRAASREELASGLRLMEALTGKLTLLAFADLGGADAPGDELDEIRTLLHRLEAMATATREVAAVHA
jgi:hypothetical protein